VGPSCQRKKRKEKEEGGVGWHGEWLVGRWAAGPEREKGVSFLFSLFFFKLFSNQSFKFKFNQIFFKLSTKLYNLFRSHTSNQK
jgi:hypothetical protein